MAIENGISALVPQLSPSTVARNAVRVLGIDLGTTNCTVAEVPPDGVGGACVRARCLEIDQETDEGRYTHVLVPSVVACKDGKILVGEGAKRARSRAGELGLSQNKSLFFECKNDMGLRRTYHRAPPDLRSARDVGSKILAFLRDAAINEIGTPDRVVVTVPASFQAAQRDDTVKAAQAAGFGIQAGDLLDEPVAAFIDFVVSQGPEAFREATGTRRLMVFDFGGGTCDVAVLEVHFGSAHHGATVAPLAVSRYHRLGGGDLDSAIVYEVLLAQLIEQNDLPPFDLSFEDKKSFVEPALLGLAEALKVGLCLEVRRLMSFDKYTSREKSEIVKTQAGLHRVRVGNREFHLQSPSLNAAQFESLLEPFLDPDLLYPTESEYRLTCSIFAPIADVLERSGVERGHIDFCLLVGGSSLIPQVQGAVRDYFTNAKLLTYPDPIDLQMAVARGAAYHAYAVATTGRRVFQPVAHDDISIRTTSGPITLVPRGAVLPVSAEAGLSSSVVLTIPTTTLLGSCEVRVEIVAGQGDRERVLFSGLWNIPGPVNKGDKLVLRRTLDENQVLSLELRLADVPNCESFKVEIENPLTHVVNPLREQLKIDEREEALRTRKVPKERIPEALAELGESYRELGHREKALEYLKRALRAAGRPDAGILSRMGLVCGDMGDTNREERFLREAAAASSWDGPLFNLALSQYRRRSLDDAQRTIDEALGRLRRGPSLVLAAQIAGARGLADREVELLREAGTKFKRAKSLDDWELAWARTMARLLEDETLEKQFEAEWKRRKKGGGAADPGGMLPDLQPGLVVRK